MRDINSLNKVILIGRLGGKPDIRYLPQKNRAVARFTLATNERILNTETRESTDRTEWHRIVVWGKLAEFCEKYLAQGKQVLVEGRLRTRKWQDRNGADRVTTEVEAYNIILLGKREGTQAAAAEEFPDQEAPRTEDVFPSGEEEGGEDDIPF